ncbi:S8 family peptidase [Jiangella alkaliphila]|uniref:Serine protease, subtilisin family n=1 Tax=Jiangella alkaliphila TaxID=419479 RepID=A0A1H2K568_9ACTN|nr:S8 family peptidase [Jiangella alkaliphila]SDU63864.1 Serine protease, subtilisin family [Jiangella alkaliphila]
MPHMFRFQQRARRRLLAPVLVAVLLAVPVGSAATPTGSVAAPRTVAEPGGDPVAQTYQVTLVTGDVAVVSVTPDGRQSAWLESAAEIQPRVYERDGHVHVVPAEAEEHLRGGRLDERLFDLTYLVREGYHDGVSDALPLLVTAPAAATLSAPAGVTVERRLTSIDAVSVSAPKAELATVWAQLDAGVFASVRLNGRVEAALDESVPQIGAPQAWEQGLDGTGATVAVLDTGFDATHPDLAGQVVGAANFTADADPDGQTAADGHGHGTHVAATVAGTGAASGGTHVGVAPGADLLVGKVLDATGSGYEDWIIAGMEWAVAQGADVVNLSLGTPDPSDGTDPLSLAVDRLSASSDTLFVVAAGNTGPLETTIGGPGAATSALTVGAVDKDDHAADFSSRGPRLGDGAAKPEVVAPGVGIVAARAAGTALGNLLDEHYTALDGTSMATPHVAGAAAILAQQHPEWDGEQLKARLVSTSTPLDGEPASFQGAGRVDVAAAVGTSSEVSDGVLNLGSLRYDDDAVSRTLTFSNPTDQRVTLRLTADVERRGPGDDPRSPIRLRQPVLSIPAGGTASTEVRVDPRGLAGGAYEGYIVAQDPRNRDVRVATLVAFAVEAPRHTLTVTAADRDGKPASGPVDLWSLDTWTGERGFFTDGVATFEVFEGTYTLAASIQTGSLLDTTSVTVATEPELVVDGDETVTFDARAGEPMTVETPLPSTLIRAQVLWRREIGGESVTTQLLDAATDRPLYVLPSDPSRTGEFDLTTAWQLEEPRPADSPEPTYSYRLVFAEADGVPAGRTYTVDHDDLAAVHGTYREASDRQVRRESWRPFTDGALLGVSMILVRDGPAQRTDYLSTDGVEWQRDGRPHWSPVSFTVTSPAELYEPGQEYQQEWWGPLVGPSIPPVTGLEEYGLPVSRHRDAIRALIPPHRFGDDTMRGAGYTPGETFELTLHRDGELVGTSHTSAIPSQFTVPPAEAQMQLRVQVADDAEYWSDLSVSTDTMWSFRSGRTGDEPAVLPLVQAAYVLDAGLYNDMPAGASYPLEVRPAYQPGATGPGGFEVTVQVSFDDGASWHAPPVTATEDGFRAQIPAAGTGFATVRVDVADADGNTMTQRIDRAWRIGRP